MSFQDETEEDGFFSPEEHARFRVGGALESMRIDDVDCVVSVKILGREHRFNTFDELRSHLIDEARIESTPQVPSEFLWTQRSPVALVDELLANSGAREWFAALRAKRNANQLPLLFGDLLNAAAEPKLRLDIVCVNRELIRY